MPFYVADYLADTMHLSPAEHGGYLMLILHYWKSGPIPDDDARLATISRLGDAWSNASSTLRAFFKHVDGMLVHDRIDREKADAIDNKGKNQARAKAAAEKRWSKNAPSNAPSMPQAMLGECPSPSPSPIYIKAKSNTEHAPVPGAPAAPKYSAKADLVDAGVGEQTAVDWLALRKAKKAPVSKTALDAIKREAEKAGMPLDSTLALCCTRGWQGFKAEWVLSPSTGSPRASPAQTSRHNGFENIDYSEGIENGRIT